MKPFLILAGALLALALALGLGYRWGHQAAPAAPVIAQQAARKILYWYDPMQPGTHFDHPGPSPLMAGMQLVPKYAGSGGAETATVRISPVVEQNLGMRTAVVRVAVLKRELRVLGTLAWDRRRSVIVSARATGLITRLFVRAPFDAVRVGQPLAELRAPAWSSALAEYHALADARSAAGRALRAAALQRLRVLGLRDDQIRAAVTAGGGVLLRAPAAGVVSVLDVRQGQQVAEGATLMRIDDPARLWLDAAVPQGEVAGIGPGTPAQIEVTAFPGRIFAGRVEALLPEVDPRTRTETARIALDNPRGLLAPGMYATVRLRVAEGAAHPLVPDQALISTGVQNRVILALGDGRMQPRAVRVGRSADGYTEVLAGLRAGERVVTSGQFLIDSEADLDGALQRLTVPPAPAASARPLSHRKRDRGEGPTEAQGYKGAKSSSPTLLPAGEGSQARKAPAHDPMPGMAMPASTAGHTP